MPQAESIVARPNRRARIRGGLIVFMGLLPVAAGIAVLAIGEIEGGLLFGAVGALVVFLGTAPWREYTIFDADGIHSHTTLRDIDAPWPDSRAAFVVREAYGRHSNTAYVVAPSAVGSFKLGAPRLVGDSGGDLRARAEAEVDEIWAWATERGYVHAAARQRRLKRRSKREATASKRLMRSRQYATAVDASADATQKRYAAVGASFPAPTESASDGAESPGRQKPLVFSGWSTQRADIIWYALLSVALILGGACFALHSASQDGMDSAAGKLGFAMGLFLALIGVRGLPYCYKWACARLVAYDEGMDYFDGVLSAWIDWPASRSSIFVTETEEYRRTVVEVRILTAEGLSVPVPGLRWPGGGDQALLAAAAAADSIWERGAASGFAVDDGGYQSAADPEFERRRVTVAHRIEYLASQE